MPRDPERLAAVQDALRDAGLDGLVCSLPANVLLLTGYWPVVGSSLAVVARGGPTIVLAPEDERELAEAGGANRVRLFQPASLEKVESTAEAVAGPLAAVARELSLEGKRIGYEGGEAFEPASYAAMHLYGAGVVRLLEQAFGRPRLVAAADHLARLRSRKTPQELDRIRTACRVAEKAFAAGSLRLKEGLKESEVAACFRAPLLAEGIGFDDVRRAGGFMFCMSGPNAAHAYAAYARSGSRKLGRGNLVLVHCNSFADGYWTDITRTYCLGRADERQQKLYDTVFRARREALNRVRPGARAADVDRAAREVLTAAGLGQEFKHSTGHGAGYAAIDHTALPRLHPHSPDVLEAGMVFNVEPAVYVEGYGGLRHCDMVAVTPTGHELLTPFHENLAELAVS
jgi:Xaa-Pro aminopeptidase